MPGAREAADPWLPAGQAAATASAMAAAAALVKVGAKRSSNASAAPAHPLSTLRRCSPQWQLRRGAMRPSSLCLHRRLLCKRLLQAGSACRRAGSRWRELNRCSVLTPSLHSSDASAIQQAGASVSGEQGQLPTPCWHCPACWPLAAETCPDLASNPVLTGCRQSPSRCCGAPAVHAFVRTAYNVMPETSMPSLLAGVDLPRPDKSLAPEQSGCRHHQRTPACCHAPRSWCWVAQVEPPLSCLPAGALSARASG